MKKRIFIKMLFATVLGLVACNGAIDESKKLAKKVKDKTQHEIETGTRKIMETVFPPFDHDKPDTDNNKQRFKDFLKVDLTDDVKNIYCFDDAIGIDSDYMFAFNCNQATSDKIIAKHKLTMDTLNTNNAFGLQHDFDWWDKERIAELQKYSWSGDHQYFKYYWYDAENEKAYFFDFDM